MTNPVSSSDDVELADAIELVRQQLLSANAAGRSTVGGGTLKFGVGKVSIEFSGEFRRTSGVSGSVKFWVVSTDVKAERSRSSTQKITVELTPLGPNAEPYRVADDIDDDVPTR